ncbi:unnamed protein product, partial [Symbiodinium pilosum]
SWRSQSPRCRGRAAAPGWTGARPCPTRCNRGRPACHGAVGRCSWGIRPRVPGCDAGGVACATNATASPPVCPASRPVGACTRPPQPLQNQ